MMIQQIDQNLTKKIKKDQIRLICKYCISNKKRDAVVASPLQEIDLLQQLPTFIIFQYLHLLDGYLIEV